MEKEIKKVESKSKAMSMNEFEEGQYGSESKMKWENQKEMDSFLAEKRKGMRKVR